MVIKYFPDKFEAKWAEKWVKDGIFTAPQIKDPKNKIYALSMFPYPSGAGLHVGHVRIYTGTDVLARYLRMKGKTVMQPMGWDAFGLPAENAAVKAKKNPMDMVPQNIANFKRQMQMMGFSDDWSREFSTTDPAYYRWTQWLFIQFFRMGLLYKKNTQIYYCEACKTGLAEEEVLPDGTHERCGKPITRRELPQWIFRITAYADRLLKDLEGLDWPNGILEMQRNWIGRKEGINITYPVVAAEKGKTLDNITVFTTRPDTNFGATFVVLAPEHEFVKKILSGEIKIEEKNKTAVADYAKKSLSKTDLERQAEGRKKTGVFTGFYAVNHLTGRLMPVWVSDFVLMGFGTGAVVGVPGHDLRDFEFASEFGIEIIRVVVGKNNDRSAITRKEQVQEEEGMMVNSGFLDGMDIHRATEKIMDYMEEKGWGRRVVTYHLRDWIFSRQRYWGEPIPMVFCAECAKNQTVNKELRIKNYDPRFNINKEIIEANAGWWPIPESDLPLKLPYVQSYEPTATGESPLSQIPEFTETKCPVCGGKARRETDTMPNWAGSCWYFLAFANPSLLKSDKPQLNSEWLPVDWYLGGAEHAVLHLLYARFWVKAMQDLGLVDFSEPFLRLRNVGMVLAEDGRKMSKSFGNVINPDDVVKEYGADALRLYEMFMAPFNQEIAWSTKTLQGTYRFLKRIWNLYNSNKFESVQEDKELVSKFNKTIEKVGNDIGEIKYNTAIAAMMEFLNYWEKNPQGLSKENVKRFLQILAPFAPYITEQIWYEVFGEKESIHLSKWPEADKSKMVTGAIVLPVQVMGKLRATITLDQSENIKDAAVKKALDEENVKKYIEGKNYKVIYVPGKILNFILVT